MLKVIIFIIGACVGSFLNVCIYRLGKGESIIRPRSHCPNCSHKLTWYENIPFLSYLMLKAKCRYCKKPISFQYPMVELIAAGFFLLFFNYFGLSILFLIYAALVSALIAAAFIDIKEHIIPDEISLPGMISGLTISFIYPGLHRLDSHVLSLLYSLLGLIAGGGTIYLLGLLGDFVFKKESMGGGDVKLLAMIGAFIGWKMVLLVFFISPLFGAIIGIILKIKKNVSIIPYGPFLSLGTVISIIWGEKIIGWLLY
ncbi:MAG: prepilin peptidase [Candidatus Omnitrophota bacterium]|nr:prepilin peptidase [Candidatus Omnitrophota bacterium]